MFDLEAADRWISEWSASVQGRAEQGQAFAERVAGIAATASGRQGAVEVTVSGSGAVTGLRLDERVRDWPARELAEEILAVMRRAQAQLAAKVSAAAAETVGADSPSAVAVIDGYARRFPSPDDTDRDTSER
jgi:DNA-binding protein YbaB